MAIKHIAHLALDKDPNEAANIPQAQDAAGARPQPQSEGGGEVPKGEEQNYPPGMVMRMSHGETSKMGHHEPPPHGASVHFEGHGRVTHVGDHPTEVGGHELHVQVTHMGMEHGEKKSLADRMYGKEGSKREEAHESKREEAREKKAGVD